MPNISIIIPAYNAANYIKDTLSSVQAQSFQNWECIIVDDCSNDTTAKVCQQYVDSDARFKYILQPKNGGPAIARNTGIHLAIGDYLAFLDSDDTYEPEFLEKMLYAAFSQHADVVWCNYNEITDSTSKECHHNLPTFAPLQNNHALQLFFQNQVGLGNMWNKIYRRSMIVEHQISINPHRYHGEDWEFNLSVFKLNPIIVAVPDVLYNYIRQNANSVVATYHHVDWDNHVRSYLLLKSLSEERGIAYNVYEQNTQFIYITISFIIALLRSSLQDKNIEFQRIISDSLLQKIINGTEFYSNRLPVRFRLYFWMIRMKFYLLCKILILF